MKCDFSSALFISIVWLLHMPLTFTSSKRLRTQIPAVGRIRLALRHLSYAASWHASRSVLKARGRDSGHLSSGVSWLLSNAPLRQPFDRERGERDREDERRKEREISAGLADSGEVWHPQHGHMSLYLTACFAQICSPRGSASFIRSSNTPLILLLRGWNWNKW